MIIVNIPVTELRAHQTARIVGLVGGRGFQNRLRSLGIREGKEISVLVSQPFGGPVVIEIDGRATTIGRGMARAIIVEQA